ncbi:MAG: helix-turn-helix transcriptional regulator [Oscillospiraceae bacterium]|jgi:transcriptional regulator with XRE-family HTH domain|nr:helix-turn-helix transcriptional regulator [Oscillospiraceae bacterium]
MNIQIGDNLKRLRRLRGVTQEELAGALGTSPQSVSNWERGDCYPDMELVPRIAGYFDVTLDDLFGMADLRSDARIAETQKRVEAIFGEPDSSRRVAELWRELAYDMPNNYTVQIALARSLLMFGMTFEETEANGREVASVLERMLEKCTDSVLRNTADSILVRAYSMSGDTKKAIEQSKRLSNASDGYENAMNFLINFDKNYRDVEGFEDTANLLHRHANNLALLLWGTISTLRGTTGSVAGLEPVNYLAGETYDELVQAYEEMCDKLSFMNALITARLNNTRAIFNDDGSFEIQLGE